MTAKNNEKQASFVLADEAKNIIRIMSSFGGKFTKKFVNDRNPDDDDDRKPDEDFEDMMT